MLQLFCHNSIMKESPNKFILAAIVTRFANAMDKDITLLITEPSEGLLAGLARRRPDWRMIGIDGSLPETVPSGEVWAFIDWLGPVMSGLELCRRLREAAPTRSAHLTIVLEDSSSESRRRALQAGADDYLVGPLTIDQLIERVEGPANQKAPARPRQLLNGTILLDPAAHQVRVDGRLVSMRPNEFRLLAHFMANPNQVFSRTALIEHLGRQENAIDERTVDVWVGRLRRALISAGAPDPLRTVRSLGYVMDSVES